MREEVVEGWDEVDVEREDAVEVERFMRALCRKDLQK